MVPPADLFFYLKKADILDFLGPLHHVFSPVWRLTFLLLFVIDAITPAFSRSEQVVLVRTNFHFFFFSLLISRPNEAFVGVLLRLPSVVYSPPSAIFVRVIF